MAIFRKALFVGALVALVALARADTYKQKINCFAGFDDCNKDYGEYDPPSSDYIQKRLGPGVIMNSHHPMSTPHSRPGGHRCNLHRALLPCLLDLVLLSLLGFMLPVLQSRSLPLCLRGWRYPLAPQCPAGL